MNDKHRGKPQSNQVTPRDVAHAMEKVNALRRDLIRIKDSDVFKNTEAEEVVFATLEKTLEQLAATAVLFVILLPELQVRSFDPTGKDAYDL